MVRGLDRLRQGGLTEKVMRADSRTPKYEHLTERKLGLSAPEVALETVGLDLFGNMLDTIAFLRVRLRALADVCIERGIITGPELLGKYNEYHERSYQAYRDLMLLRPDVFVQRFAEWLQTERDYRVRLAGDPAPQP